MTTVESKQQQQFTHFRHLLHHYRQFQNNHSEIHLRYILTYQRQHLPDSKWQFNTFCLIIIIKLWSVKYVDVITYYNSLVFFSLFLSMYVPFVMDYLSFLAVLGISKDHNEGEIINSNHHEIDEDFQLKYIFNSK